MTAQRCANKGAWIPGYLLICEAPVFDAITDETLLRISGLGIQD